MSDNPSTSEHHSPSQVVLPAAESHHVTVHSTPAGMYLSITYLNTLNNICTYCIHYVQILCVHIYVRMYMNLEREVWITIKSKEQVAS